MTHPNAQRNMVPRSVLMKTGLKSFNTARIVNTAHPKSTVFSAKPMLCFPKTAQSIVRRPFQSKITLSNKRFTHKVNTAKAQVVNTARPKTVKIARPNSAVVNAVRINQVNTVKASACWVWRPTKPNSASITLKKHNYIDAQGRSKHVKRGRDTKIPQSSGPLVKVGDEAVHKELGDKMERAAATASSLEAEQDSDTSIRSDLHLKDARGTDCLLTATIFEELARMGAKTTAWNEFSSTMASAIICLATNQKFNFSKYIFDAMAKHLEGGREGKDFSRRITPLFETMMVQANQEEGVDSGIPTDSYQTPITTQPSSSRSQKKQSRRKQRKDTAVTQEETQQDDSVPTPSNDPPLSEKAKDAQAKDIADLKKRVHKLERKKKSRPTGLKRLRKVGMSRRVESSEDKDSLGDHEDASKQGRSIEDIDKDADVSLVDDTQGRSDDAEMFDTNDLHGDEIAVDMLVGEKQEQSAKEREVNTSVKDSVAPTTIEEITLAQTLIQIKEAKPKVVTTAATTLTTTRPKARGVLVQELSEFRTPQESQPSMIKDKGKAIMIEPEVPLKRKNKVSLDEDLARNLQAQLEAELIEEERLARKKEEEANIALIESWDNTQAMTGADFELA
ncbi:hypothetical protein Tco_1185940 [Tanacetum coccineum]